MFLDDMTTDIEPASDTLVLRSLTRRLKRERKRNEHLYYLLKDRNFHLKRLHNVVVKLRKRGVVELLTGLEEDKLKELLGACSLITDPLGQELIKRAASEEEA